MRKKIRLTEARLCRLVEGCARRVLKEYEEERESYSMDGDLPEEWSFYTDLEIGIKDWPELFNYIVEDLHFDPRLLRNIVLRIPDVKVFMMRADIDEMLVELYPDPDIQAVGDSKYCDYINKLLKERKIIGRYGLEKETNVWYIANYINNNDSTGALSHLIGTDVIGKGLEDWKTQWFIPTDSNDIDSRYSSDIFDED